MRFGLRTALAALLIFVCALSYSALASEKKGAGVSRRVENGTAIVNTLSVDWYYNWDWKPLDGVAPAIEFVPMIWGRKQFDQFRAAAGASGFKPQPHILGFNEPDRERQANLSVDFAVESWPQISKFAGRMASPAPARALGPWMTEFMDRAAGDGLKIDIVAVHWYGPPRPDRLLRFLDRVHAQYGKPIWITEFAVMDRDAAKRGYNRYTSPVVVKFLQEVLPELEKRDYVEKYAWFGFRGRGGDSLLGSRFYDDAGKITPVGAFYAAFQ